MNHDRAKHLLPAFADRQLDPVRRFFLSRHVARCPSCLMELEAMQSMSTAIRTNLPVHRAPPALAMRIGSALPREAPPVVLRLMVPSAFTRRTAMAGKRPERNITRLPSGDALGQAASGPEACRNGL